MIQYVYSPKGNYKKRYKADNDIHNMLFKHAISSLLFLCTRKIIQWLFFSNKFKEIKPGSLTQKINNKPL